MTAQKQLCKSGTGTLLWASSTGSDVHMMLTHDVLCVVSPQVYLIWSGWWEVNKGGRNLGSLSSTFWHRPAAVGLWPMTVVFLVFVMGQPISLLFFMGLWVMGCGLLFLWAFLFNLIFLGNYWTLLVVLEPFCRSLNTVHWEAGRETVHGMSPKGELLKIPNNLIKCIAQWKHYELVVTNFPLQLLILKKDCDCSRTKLCSELQPFDCRQVQLGKMFVVY